MARFNTKNRKFSAIQTTGEQTKTHEGGIGFKRDAKSELFLLAVSFMGGDTNFYETSDGRYNRLTALARTVAVEDPEWMTNFIRWVRNSAMMRTVAGVMAVEAVMARLAYAASQEETYRTSQGATNRRLIDVACARADEPGEILAYYLSRYGKPIPLPIEKGLGDAVKRLYTERGYLRYGGGKRAISMKDVLRLTHPKPDPWQSNLFSYITRPDLEVPVFATEMTHPLTKIAARNRLMAIPQHERRMILDQEPELIAQAEMGWEHISSWLGKMDKEAWEAVIPNMGVMALLRNLRNFDEYEISDTAYEMAARKLIDPEEIKKSRILPMRVLSAYRNVHSVRWHYPLEKCLNQTVQNIPVLDGRTLVLIDMSQSMGWGRISDRSQLTYADAAKIFGSVLAVRNRSGVELIQYGSYHDTINFSRGTSVLNVMKKFHGLGGTNTAQTLRETYNGHDRVIIVTDEQAHFDGYGAVGEGIAAPIYTWNLAGYTAAHTDGTNRFTFGGGFSDAAFGMIKYIEDGRKAAWPWEIDV